MDKERIGVLRSFEESIGVKFNNLKLLNQALTHSSYVYEKNKGRATQNERLEFLGDVVLSLIVSEYIYNYYPDYMEGELAKIRAVVVSRPILARIAKSVGVGEFLLLGKGEELTGGRKRHSILADTFEAIVGAIYLDSGLLQARKFVLSLLEEEIGLASRNESVKDYKTILQEFTQDRYKMLPTYEVIRVLGPDHKRRYEVNVIVKGEVFGKGSGRSKKEAEQNAAYRALNKLKRSEGGELHGF
ncbi:MAG: ribonuclease III [bacterium]|nr:ribonuclease III [bacterium]